MKIEFEYLIECTPIDDFGGMKDIDDKNLLNYINEVVFNRSKEQPHTAKHFYSPNFECFDTDFCVIAKIYENGTTYIFTNNKHFADFICREGNGEIYKINNRICIDLVKL
jgi:hypothetical protein